MFREVGGGGVLFLALSSQGWGGPGALTLPRVGGLPTTMVTDAFSQHQCLLSLSWEGLSSIPYLLVCLLVCNKCLIFFEVPILDDSDWHPLRYPIYF